MTPMASFIITADVVSYGSGKQGGARAQAAAWKNALLGGNSKEHG